MSIKAQNISKKFGHFNALHEVNLEIPSGELVALLGPSGSGKTTLLRIIAGLEFADSGNVLFDGEDITDRTARDRRVGFVFQHYALFRHMTVFENIAFGLKVRPRKLRPSKDEINYKVHELLKLIQLRNLANRYPSQLSGGQRQRVALARALAVEPSVLLLDEPFGSLDAKVRLELRRWLRQLHDEVHITSVFVTHDQDEALSMADQVAVLSGGRVLALSTPRGLYTSPPNEAAAAHLGEINVLQARLENDIAHSVLGELALAAGATSGSGVVMVRAEQVRLHDHSVPASVAARVAQFDFYGHDALVHLALETDPDVAIVARVDGGSAARAGDATWLTVEGSAVVLAE